VADLFLPGQHELTTSNLPVLSRLRGWKYGFESPFKADVIFVSTRQFAGAKWGTKTPVMTTDATLGPVRLRAYGTFGVRIANAESFVRELVGSNELLAIDQISELLRDLITARFADTLAEQKIPVLELAAHYVELGDEAGRRLAPDMARFGLEITQMIVESVALPDEVAATLDQRTRIGLIGDISTYAQLQAADAVRDAARNPGGGGAGAAIGVGLALGQTMAASAAAAMGANHVAPPPIPQVAFYLAVDGKPAGPFDLAALRGRFQAGTLNRATLVWREGMPQWVPAGDVPEVASLLS
jgi:membrane protease subunit (stomatin/prohibitin family)